MPASVHYVNGAREARVEGVDCAQNFERTFGIRNRRLEERGFVRPTLASGISRSGIPGGRNYRLVILDTLLFDFHPMPQRSARRLEEAESLARFSARSSGSTFLRCGCARCRWPNCRRALRPSPPDGSRATAFQVRAPRCAPESKIVRWAELSASPMSHRPEPSRPADPRRRPRASVPAARLPSLGPDTAAPSARNISHSLRGTHRAASAPNTSGWSLLRTGVSRLGLRPNTSYQEWVTYSVTFAGSTGMNLREIAIQDDPARKKEVSRNL